MPGINVNQQRFLSDFEALSAIGQTEDGLERPAGSVAYSEARKFLKRRMEEAGLLTRIDAAGNLFGVLGNGDRKILSGSHLDSVTHGGVYDGPLGIVAALEAVCAIAESGAPLAHSIEVAAFNGEEGGPLGGTFGSRAFCGFIKPGDIDDKTLSDFDIVPSLLKSATVDHADYAASLELHIEQGPVLERRATSIGIPTGIVGISRFRVTVRGTANHAGTTPMTDRRDALHCAVNIMQEWYSAVDGRDDFVCNFGELSVSPNQISVVQEEAAFTLEIRSLSAEITDEAAKIFQAIAQKPSNCDVSLKTVIEKPPVKLDRRIIDVVASVCADKNLSFIEIPSGASHDSSPIAQIIPAGMIFVPSRAGISHSKEEYTSPEDMQNGVECLAAALLKLDRIMP